MTSYIVPFSNIDAKARLINQPIAMLAEVYNKGADVAPGFCLDYRSYRDFVNQNKLQKIIHHATSNLDKKNQTQLDKNLEQLKASFRQKHLPELLSEELELVLGELWNQGHSVSIRVSYPDLPQNFITLPPLDSQQYLKTERQLKEIWAELVFRSNLLPLPSQNLKNFNLLFQRVESTEISINAYSQHPLENQNDTRYLETWWGWHLNQTDQFPETYFVKKDSCHIERLSLNHQTDQTVLMDNKLVQKPVANHLVEIPKLTERLVRQICLQIRDLEDHYSQNLKINFGYVRGKLFIHSILPLTIVEAKSAKTAATVNNMGHKTHQPILVAKTAYPGKVSGRVLHLKTIKDYQQITKKHICVANHLDMRFLNYLKKAGGLICAQAGQHQAAAILAREWKMPTLIGVSKPKTKLTNNQIVTLDSTIGCVFEGSSLGATYRPDYNQAIKSVTQKIGIEIDDPFILPSLSAKSFSGNLLIPSDRIIQSYVGVHPNQIKYPQFHNQYKASLEKILDSFHSNTAIVMTNKLNMSQLRKLKYGSKYEAKIEGNSNLVYGPARYMLDPGLFKRELKIIADISKERYSQDVKVCVPSIRTKSEFEFVYKWIERYELVDRFLISIDINSTMFILDDLFQMASFDIVIDLPSLAKQLVVRDRLDSDLIHQSDPAGLGMVLEIMKFSAQRRGVSAYLRTGNLKFGPEQLKFLEHLDLEEIILEGVLG